MKTLELEKIGSSLTENLDSINKMTNEYMPGINYLKNYFSTQVRQKH